MEFGLVAVSALPSRSDMSGKDAFDYALKACSVAQQSGFDAIGISHKYLSGPAHQFLAPLVAAAHIFARCPGMYVSTNVFLLPYFNPVDVAQQVATLDMMAPGKFLFGIGQGYRADESQAFGVPNSERARRMTESLAAMRLLWRDGAASFHGEFWQFENADIGIKPVNGKGPPIIFAADKINSVARIPDRGGDHWIPSARHSKGFLREAMPVYRDALARAGKPFTGLPLIRDIAVAENRRAAEALVRESITDYLHRQSGWGQPGEAYDVSFDELKQDRLILGTVEEAAAELIALHEEFAAKFVTFRIYTPGMDTERALDVVRQIGTEVLPLVRREVGTASMFA
jgi:alkanesulfonate monooxygenase SsuD/methylene tetrahydromethanopterin reductase-like flavin-dependent oxidoreductase (luciferase family)